MHLVTTDKVAEVLADVAVAASVDLRLNPLIHLIGHGDSQPGHQRPSFTLVHNRSWADNFWQLISLEALPGAFCNFAQELLELIAFCRILAVLQGVLIAEWSATPLTSAMHTAAGFTRHSRRLTGRPSACFSPASWARAHSLRISRVIGGHDPAPLHHLRWSCLFSERSVTDASKALGATFFLRFAGGCLPVSTDPTIAWPPASTFTYSTVTFCCPFPRLRLRASSCLV